MMGGFVIKDWFKSVFGNLFLVLGLVLSSGCYGVITFHDDRYWLSAKQYGGFRIMAGYSLGI